MLHRAILGSMERWIGILIEEYAGKWPLWLSPVQIIVATITQEADDYAEKVYIKAQGFGLRVSLDKRNEKIGYKIREHLEKKIPIIFVVGRKEAEMETISIRRLGTQEQQVIELNKALDSISIDAMPPDLARIKNNK